MSQICFSVSTTKICKFVVKYSLISNRFFGVCFDGSFTIIKCAPTELRQDISQKTSSRLLIRLIRLVHVLCSIRSANVMHPKWNSLSLSLPIFCKRVFLFLLFEWQLISGYLGWIITASQPVNVYIHHQRFMHGNGLTIVLWTRHTV